MGIVEQKGFSATFRKKHRFTSFITLVRASAKIQWANTLHGRGNIFGKFAENDNVVS